MSDWRQSVERHIREKTKLEMDENTFALLDSILEENLSARLMITRGSVGLKLVAVIKAAEDT